MSIPLRTAANVDLNAAFDTISYVANLFRNRQNPRRTRLGYRNARSRQMRLPQRSLLRRNGTQTWRMLRTCCNEVLDVPVGVPIAHHAVNAGWRWKAHGYMTAP